MNPEVVADYACQTGENPLWHPTEKCLYWVDIPGARLFRFDPATGRHEICLEGEVIGGFTVQVDGALLLLTQRCEVKTWRDGLLTTIRDGLPGEEENRFNDCIADPEGRVFCGVLSTPQRAGRLYRLDPDGAVSVMTEGLGTSNGMGFTPDGKHLYHSDSNDRCRHIHLYDYDRATGELSNRRLFLKAKEGEGKPDGLTVDAQGNVWSARWNGGMLVQYTPEAAEIARVTFPAQKVSSLAFGGDDLSDLYVTTAGGDHRAEEGPGAGALFRLRPGVQGRPEFFSRIG
ncbi:MAG: SMP-30/gluconolactonase/LRE family protein [Pirellulales bacterium]|nr:SMP-30/gluconolactonase/LRE family protein [Pirellulales bacterium]